MDVVRLICAMCGVKWFLRGTRRATDEPLVCAACGGRLIALEVAGGEPAPGWGDGTPPASTARNP